MSSKKPGKSIFFLTFSLFFRYTRNMETIGDRLRTLRKELGLNQGEFAQGIGLKQGSYSEIENGKEKLTQKNMEFISLKYAVNMDWLQKGNGPMFRSIELSPAERELLEIYDKLIPETQKEVRDYAHEKLELQELRKKADDEAAQNVSRPLKALPQEGEKGINPVHNKDMG
jgi:transcriptional regulator with XRE-family HTH domain